MTCYRVSRPGHQDAFTFSREQAAEAERAGATVEPSALFLWREAVGATVFIWAAMLGLVGVMRVIGWVAANCPDWVLAVGFCAIVGATPLWRWLLKGDRR